jgi:hypothetical protein
MVCAIHRSLNAALTYYKQRMCTGAEVPVNYDKTYMAVAK